MKKLIFSLFFIFHFSLFTLLAQNNTMSKADSLVNRPDVVIQKDFTNISKVETLAISVEQITNLSGTVANMKHISALDLEDSFVGSNYSINSSVLLDPDEVDNVIAFIQSMTDNIFKTPAPPDDREFTMVSRSGFEIGCYWNKGWCTYVKLDTHDRRTNLELTRDDLMAFQSFLKQAKAKFY